MSLFHSDIVCSRHRHTLTEMQHETPWKSHEIDMNYKQQSRIEWNIQRKS